MKSTHIITALLIAISFVPSTFAQVRPEAAIDFTTRFDNREYKTEINPDQTLFGSKIRPEAGIRWFGNNVLMVGGDFTLDFGKYRDKRDPELIIYYGYESERFSAYTGIFQRDKTINEYPRAIFSDSVSFYDANLSGALLQYRGRRGYIELALDWNSMISHTQHEKFMVFSNGQFDHRDFSFGYFGYMYHHAGTLDISGVVDNLIAYPYVGYRYRLPSARRTTEFKLRAGWIQLFQNDRRFEAEWVTPGGFQGEFTFRWHTLELYNTIYAGKGLMPYYFRYGQSLYNGDQFYRTDEGIYNRLELSWTPVDNKMFFLKLSSVHHYDGLGWGSQQLATFAVKLSRKTFRSRRDTETTPQMYN